MKLKTLLLFVIYNSILAYASQVDTLMVYSQSMTKSIPNVVIQPDGYANQEEAFPVLYLLHGAGGDFSGWVTSVPKIKEYVDKYNIIIVCPDGASTSWYFDSPIDAKMKYESYVSKELIEAIDAKYNTLATKSGRAITGLSMGGHGALYLAFKHQDI